VCVRVAGVCFIRPFQQANVYNDELNKYISDTGRRRRVGHWVALYADRSAVKVTQLVYNCIFGIEICIQCICHWKQQPYI